LRTFRFQIYFSLLYYPLFTLFLPVGDWRIIYNFQATPVISVVTAVIHAVALLLFWRADRSGKFEMVAFNSPADQARYEMMARAVGDPAAQLQTIAMAKNGGAPRQAGRLLDEFLKTHPESAEGYLQLALLSLETNRGQPSRDVIDATEKAIALGLRDPNHVILARQLAASHYLERGDGAEAEAQLNAALAQTAGFDADGIDPLRRAHLHRLLSQAYRRQGRYNEASSEIEIAIRIAEDAGLTSAVQEFQGEQEVIKKHAGRTLATSVET
jgi:tetratricopeptide (TPR) repeat protein